MKVYFITVVFYFLTVAAIAQSKINFSSQNYVGLLAGEGKTAFQVQTVNGIIYKAWFAGLGTGIDWYYLRSIPLFASFGRDFFKIKKGNFYISADGGVNFAWSEPRDYNVIADQKYIPAIYYGAGLGYKMVTGKNAHVLLINIGYSYKHIRERLRYLHVIDSSDSYLTEYYDDHLRRLSLKFGWGF